MVYLIRHAHAGNKHQWPGRDGDRPLSEPGHQEAQGLLARLRDYPITRIMASPALRCQQTVEPLSQRRAVPIELVDALSVDAPPVRLLQLVTDPGIPGGAVRPRRADQAAAGPVGRWWPPDRAAVLAQGVHLGPRHQQRTGDRRALPGAAGR
jgi:hypothetical protein